MSKWRKEVFTEEEAAAFLIISKCRICQLVEEGKLAVVRDGPQYTRFLRQALLDYQFRQHAGPLPQAEDMAALRAYRRQTEAWRQVYKVLMGKKDEELSIISSLYTYFPGEEAGGLATLLRDLEWPELMQASRTLVEELSIIEKQGTLTALVQACQELVQALSQRDSSLPDVAASLEEKGEAAHQALSRYPQAAWRRKTAQTKKETPINRRTKKEVFTEEEAAAFLITSKRRIRRLVREGKLGVVRDGPKYTRFLWQDLSDYLCRHQIGPLPQAEDIAALRAHRRQTEGWRQVYTVLMGEKDEELSIISSLHTCFPGEEAEGLATLLCDLEWPELTQASRTLVEELSVIEKQGTLTTLVQACQELVQALSQRDSSLPDVAASLEEKGETVRQALSTWSDTLTPCCHTSWRLPRLEEGDWEAARVCTQCDRIWTLTELREALARQEAEEES